MVSTILGQVSRDACPNTETRVKGQFCPMPIHISINVFKISKNVTRPQLTLTRLLGVQSDVFN